MTRAIQSIRKGTRSAFVLELRDGNIIEINSIPMSTAWMGIYTYQNIDPKIELYSAFTNYLKADVETRSEGNKPVNRWLVDLNTTRVLLEREYPDQPEQFYTGKLVQFVKDIKPPLLEFGPPQGHPKIEEIEFSMRSIFTR